MLIRINRGESISSKIESPTPEHVREAMAGVISGDIAFYDLRGDDGILTLNGSDSGRIRVLYMDIDHTPENTHQYHWGIALDPSLADDEREVEVNYGTETTPGHIYETLLSDRALEIALYFLEHEAPPKGLQWQGRMDRFQ